MKWGQGLPSQEGGFEDTPGGLSRLCRGLLVQGGRAWRWVDWRGSLLPSNSHILPQVCGWRKDVSTGTWRELPDTLPDLGGLAFRVIWGPPAESLTVGCLSCSCTRCVPACVCFCVITCMVHA